MNKKLYVGNLDYSVSASELKAAFSAWEVTECKVIENKGFAFITFATVKDTTTAKEELMNKELKGRPMKIDVAQENFNGNRNSGGSRNDYQKRY